MDTVLSWIIFMPLLGMALGGVLRASLNLLRLLAFGSSLLVLALALALAWHFDADAGMQFVMIAPWIKSYGVTYYVGVDAFSLILVLIIALLMPLLYLYMYREARHGYWYLMMALQTGVMGAALSLDLMLFYLFWETMLLPVFIMIGRYGSNNHPFYAMKLLVMTVFGSMAMLLSILYMGYGFYAEHGFWSFALSDLAQDSHGALVAAGFLLAFAIKIPLPLFHTWMAGSYGSAPTPAVVIMSSVMAKLGAYGLWRFGFSLFEGSLHHFEPYLIALALFGLLFFALHAVMERDLRRMFAYSSGSHLSLIALGIMIQNHYGLSGALYLIATHALASAGIFLMIGLIFARVRTLEIAQLGGIAQSAPKFAFFFAFFALCIAGVPGTGGFVAELLIIIGAFEYGLATGVLAATTILAAILFIFWMLQRVLFGPQSRQTEGFVDLGAREVAMLAPLVLLLLLSGIAPNLFTPLFEPSLALMLGGRP
ncbi:MAG: NADH-quinone oxidoreductase subunit M [Campylobacterales bacterium]|nr:NADH-quinone oxidoreductase subunit M [Campylobacterales bacterium]